jgi:hypothetical protein
MSTPAVKLNGSTIMDEQPARASGTTQPDEAAVERPAAARNDTTYSKYSQMSVPPEGSILTGKQEHCEIMPLPAGREC